MAWVKTVRRTDDPWDPALYDIVLPMNKTIGTEARRQIEEWVEQEDHVAMRWMGGMFELFRQNNRMTRPGEYLRKQGGYSSVEEMLVKKYGKPEYVYDYDRWQAEVRRWCPLRRTLPQRPSARPADDTADDLGRSNGGIVDGAVQSGRPPHQGV